MKPQGYIKYLIVAVLTAAVCFGIMYMCSDHKPTELEISSPAEIIVTPQVVTKVKEIGQWELVNIVDEEVIDTVRKRTLLPDESLTLIFHGTLRLGIDLANAKDGWVRNVNDTLTVTLPMPSLLDDRFIDEALTTVFYQKGKWTGADRENMYNRAANAMRKRALTSQNIKRAKSAAKTHFEDLFTSLGAKSVIVEFDNQ